MTQLRCHPFRLGQVDVPQFWTLPHLWTLPQICHSRLESILSSSKSLMFNYVFIVTRHILYLAVAKSLCLPVLLVLVIGLGPPSMGVEGGPVIKAFSLGEEM